MKEITVNAPCAAQIGRKHHLNRLPWHLGLGRSNDRIQAGNGAKMDELDFLCRGRDWLGRAAQARTWVDEFCA